MKIAGLKWATRLGVLLVAALALAAPGTAQAQMGNPAFAIQSWELSTNELTRAAEFDLTVTFSNIGSWGANDVIVELAQNPNFFALGQPPYVGNMGIGDTRSATLHVGISPTITTGYYNIPVSINYHHSALGGSRMSDVSNLGVYVTGLSPFQGADTGSPRLVIEDSRVAVSEDGGVLLVTLTLHNVGNRSATNIVVNLADTSVLSPARGSSTAFPVETDIHLDQTAEVTLPLVLVSSPGQRFTQGFTLQYNSFSGGVYNDTQSVPILLGDVVAQTPRLLIDRYSTDPAAVSPGAQFTLNLELLNVGAGPARQVFLRLGDNAQALGPLAPSGMSNVQYIESIEAGQRHTASYTLVVDGRASPGLVPLDVKLEYNDVFGASHQETLTIGVRIVANAFLQIGLFQPVPEPLLVGQPFELPIEVINIGDTRINVSTVSATSEDLTIEDGSLYIGPLDGGTSGTLIAQATATAPGTAEVTVTVNYLDDFQQPRQVTHTLTFEVVEAGAAPTPGEETAAPGGMASPSFEENPTLGQRILRGVLGFFGLATRDTGSGAAIGEGGG